MRHTGYGVFDVIGFAASVACFGDLRAGLRFVLARPVFLVLDSGSCLGAYNGLTFIRKSNSHSKVVPTAHLCGAISIHGEDQISATGRTPRARDVWWLASLVAPLLAQSAVLLANLE